MFSLAQHETEREHWYLSFDSPFSTTTNIATALSTSKLLLVPYSQHHVPQYHAWMQDPDLQTATASEPLSLEEEYAMQQSWRTDRDKLTFIICLPLPKRNDIDFVKAGEDDVDERTIGDINLFLFEEDDASPKANSIVSNSAVVGEIELMIAHKDLQRQGYGRAALLTFLQFVHSNWSQIAEEYAVKTEGQELSLPDLAYLRVKINQNNQRSIALFESVGFRMVDEDPNYFGEVELRWKGDSTSLAAFPGFEQPRELQYRPLIDHVTT